MEYKEKVSYKIDKDNIIIEIFDDWITAAKVGQASDLINVNSVLGTKLLSYILGDSTRMYYDAIFQKCRLLNEEHKIEYRCDSPTHKRTMEMQIIPNEDKNIDIYNFLIKEEPFKNAIYVHENTTSNIRNPIVRCSVCNHLKLKTNGEWMPPEHLVQKEELNFIVIHSVCPQCKNRDWRGSIRSAN